MKVLKIISWSAFQLISVLFLLLYLLGVLNIYFSDRSNYCAMTYMFEYPQFVRITVPDNDWHPQYALYAYSEGRLTERARKMWFDGIPVLFLPGNSGSHMQGRSLASVALRMAISDMHERHFDFFMVSFNEDLSGLYGGVLHSETDFAVACITKILSLYKNNKYTKSVPSTVILIGHSMGGLVAKRLLAHPETLHTTSIAITLAAPLQAPVVNFDMAFNDFYKFMNSEWNYHVKGYNKIRQKKLLLSFGNGARDLLMPSGLTSSNDSDVNVMTTSIPGVWISPDHVGVVWCKQLVMAITKYLFDIVNPDTHQVYSDKKILLDKARHYFQANRSMLLDPAKPRQTVNMVADAFWYEDSRRIYQIKRPEIDKTTYLMIRLVPFPQNRFVALEAINVEDKDWVFGCNAKHVYGTYRYCKQATSLSELSRWSGSLEEFGKRKLATIHLHDVMDKYPDWTHVIVKVSPTRKPIVLNVDINDHASRSIVVDLPFGGFSLTVIKSETEKNSIYYELVLPGFDNVNQAYLLYVEPTESCKATSYLVTAELHVPWAVNSEVYHYFTHVKQSPMKLRLFKSNPNVTLGQDATQFASVTLVLDPQCTYKISIASSSYYGLGQLVRNYTPILAPYMAAILLLAAASNIQHMKEHGTTISIHSALMSEAVKPYYCLVFSRLVFVAVTSIPILSFVVDYASWNNPELINFSRSLLVLPLYMTALGIVNVATLGIIGVLIFSSQLAHRLLIGIIWRGRGGGPLAERLAHGLQNVPMLVSVTLACIMALSCGAAALVAGAAFYAFKISNMYEEYLEDYIYKLMAKMAGRMCQIFKSKRGPPTTDTKEDSQEVQTTDPAPIEGNTTETLAKEDTLMDGKKTSQPAGQNAKVIIKKTKKPKKSTKVINTQGQASDQSLLPSASENNENIEAAERQGKKRWRRRQKSDEEIDEELNNLNFHVMMFFLWLVVAIMNIPALLTWARDFRYNTDLKPDTSYHTGLVMTACSACIWQLEGPRKKLKNYERVSSILFGMAVLILAVGPFALYVANYGVALVFAIITLQQLIDKEIVTEVEENEHNENNENDGEPNTDLQEGSDSTEEEEEVPEEPKGENDTSDNETTSQCDPCSESRLYNVFKNLKEKLNLSNEL